MRWRRSSCARTSRFQTCWRCELCRARLCMCHGPAAQILCYALRVLQHVCLSNCNSVISAAVRDSCDVARHHILY